MIGPDEDPDLYPTNPAQDLDPVWRRIFALYTQARPLPGVLPLPVAPGIPPLMVPLPSAPGPLPDAGGLLDQGAWLMDVFDIMSGADAQLMKAR